jgi:site-specific DNA-cytosine methylase
MTEFIRAIDLCAGAGGWACAARRLPIRITHAFDFWPIACKTYGLNHPDTKIICGDLRDPAVQAQVQALRGQVDLVIALTHQNVGRDWVIARRVQGIDIIIGGHDKQKVTDPYVADKTRIVQSGEKGQYLGQLEVTIQPDG